MRKLIACLALVVSCSPEPDASGNRAGGPEARSARGATKQPRLESLTGLYESAGPGNMSQLCIVDGQFGIVVWGGGLSSCSGSGRADRDGDRVRLRMTGDSPCTLDARISGKAIVLPEAAPSGCGYYCGARARLQGIELRQAGASRSDALKARDLVGEPLCSE